MLGIGPAMEIQAEQEMNATPNETPLMDGGPLFDRSGMAPTTGQGTQGQRHRTHTPIRFDIGSTQFSDDLACEQYPYLAGGTSSGSMGFVQMLRASDMLPSVEQGSVANYYQNSVQITTGQRTPGSGTQLPRLPDSLPTRSELENNHEEAQQEEGGSNNHTSVHGIGSSDSEAIRVATDRLCKLGETMIQFQASMQSMHEQSCKSMEMAAKIMTDFVTAQMHRELAKEERKARDRAVELDMKMSAGASAVNDPYFNWMFGHGVAPRVGNRKATSSQIKFAKVKNIFKANAMWFILDATEDELKQPFVQFNETPRTSIDGIYLRKHLRGELDVSEPMAFALVRTLRRDENFRYPGAQGECHYVMHTWAKEVMSTTSTVNRCEELFMQPMLQYSLAGCNKVVAFVALDDGFASVSMDFIDATTFLIHPAVSYADPQAVLQSRLPMMKILTAAAQTHMAKLGEIVLPEKLWEFGVALKGGTKHYPADIGVATAFYSIPKDSQFMPVRHDTITMAKNTFLYSLMRMSFSETRQKIRRSARRKALIKDSMGRYIIDDTVSHQSHAESHGSFA